MFEKIFFKKTENLKSDKEKSNQKGSNVLEGIRKLNSKNLILTMALVSSLNSFARASEGRGNVETNTFKSEIIDSKERIEFQAVNYFASDSDFISKEAEEKIGADFKKLLDQINDNNYKQIIEDGIYVYSSADPEKTNNFKDNEALARARAESLIKLLKEYLEDVSFSNLSLENSKEFKEKIKFFTEIPTSSVVSNPQVGVTYPEDLGYSEEVLSNISSEGMDEIYAKCRKVVVSLGVYKNDTYYVSDKDFMKPISPKSDINIENQKNIDNKINWNAQNIVILIDDSPSVGDRSYKEILEKIMNDTDLNSKKIEVSFFSTKLDKTVICEDVKEVIKVVDEEKYQGNNVEQALSSSLSKIQSLPTPENSEQSTIMKIFTDENLQNVSLDMIRNFELEAGGKNVDAKFYYVDKDNNGLMQININEIKEAIENQLLKDMQGVLQNYVHNKKNEIRNMNEDERKIAKKQLDDLSVARESGNLDGVLNSPLLNDVYKYRNAKGVLMKKGIPVVSLKNIGHRASTSSGNLVYDQR